MSVPAQSASRGDCSEPSWVTRAAREGSLWCCSQLSALLLEHPVNTGTPLSLPWIPCAWGQAGTVCSAFGATAGAVSPVQWQCPRLHAGMGTAHPWLIPAKSHGSSLARPPPYVLRRAVTTSTSLEGWRGLLSVPHRKKAFGRVAGNSQMLPPDDHGSAGQNLFSQAV